jgi:hypothetical protein
MNSAFKADPGLPLLEKSKSLNEECMQKLPLLLNVGLKSIRRFKIVHIYA